MSCRGRCGFLSFALLGVAGVALAQGSGPVIVDLSTLSANLEPDFTLWRTGEGEAGKWTIVADPTAVNGQALGQLSNDRTDYRFPLAIYKPYSG